MNSFDLVVLLRNMQKENKDDDLYIEKSNGKRVVIHPNDDINDVCGCVMILKGYRDIAINPDHIISIINKGDLV